MPAKTPAKSRGKKMREKEVQKEIQELLDLTGWSQVELADELGVHESTLSLWLSGKRVILEPSRKLLRHFLALAREKKLVKQPA